MTDTALYAFIETNPFPISVATTALEVSRASYYRHINHQPTNTELRRAEVRKQVQAAYTAAQGRYGAPKITVVINQQRQDKVGVKLVQKLMRQDNLRAITHRKYRATKASNPVAERKNIIEQDFSTSTVNEKWAGDITYIYTQQEGWTYLCTFMDMFSRRIVGFSYGRRMTDSLVLNAFNNALLNREVTGQLIVHTDLGSQFIGQAFEEQLQLFGIQHSYSHKATPYDNAIIESFHATYKREEYYVFPEHYQSFKMARLYVFEFIEKWYNRTRIHGSLNMVSPVEFEKEQ